MVERPYWYKLVNGKPEPADMMGCVEMFRNAEELRRIECTKINGLSVSTIFLGIDHQWRQGPPILFETMVFGDGPWDEFQRRYSTMGEAKQGHFEVVDAINAGKGPEDLE